MKTVFHKSDERGFADHGWLKAYHSFSFAGWFDPNKTQFGKLRVLNDDVISPGNGFGTHPHENMEIVSIPLQGELAHKDNHGHQEVIKYNEVQVMSAGTGINHSEFNPSNEEITNLLQIWIFPDKKGHSPRYDQAYFDPSLRTDKIHTFISPEKNRDSLWLNQEAYLSWSKLSKSKEVEYSLHNSNNGVYIFLIDGVIKLGDQTLTKRDAIGVWETDSIVISSNENSEFLIIEVPMN